MNKPVPDEPPFREMSELAARVFGPVAALTKIEMPGDIDARYRAFFHSAQSAIQAPDGGGDDVDARSRHVLGVVGEVVQGLEGAAHHQQQVAQLERSILEVCRAAYAQGPPIDMQAVTTAAIPAPKLTAEYHAFLFDIRRCFEYLSRAVVSYFERSSGSFRRLPKALNGAEPVVVAQALTIRVEAAIVDFEDVLGRGGARAPRDRVGHTSPEPPGHLNLHFSPDGVISMNLVGGAEDFEMRGLQPEVFQLGPLLLDRIFRFERLMYELLSEFPMIREAAQAALENISRWRDATGEPKLVPDASAEAIRERAGLLDPTPGQAKAFWHENESHMLPADHEP
jgi:hypothetical protein